MVSRVHLRSALAVPAIAILCVSGFYAPASQARPVRAKSPPPTTLVFDDTCMPGQRATIAAVGDLLFHDVLQAQAYKPGATFRQFWSPVASVLAGADITYGNLESPIAAGVRPGGVAHKDPGRVLDRVVYGRKGDALVFNTHPSVAADLKASGFTVVSTANNHTADRGPLGIDRTLDALTAVNLQHTGARARGALTPWHTRTTANGITVAWLACTYGLNGMPDPHHQVLQCHRDRDALLNEIRTLAGDVTVDAVIVTPHWGEENQHRPTAREKVLARDMVDAGATAILGAHPHVLQPWEKVVAPDGREALVVYSLGNFISNQQSDAQRTGAIALLELTKPDGASTRISGVGYVPTFVEMSSGHRVTELLPGRNPYDAAMRILPQGNRVTAANISTLPRICKPATPVVVAALHMPDMPAVPAGPVQAEAKTGTPPTVAPTVAPTILPVALVSRDPPPTDVVETTSAPQALTVDAPRLELDPRQLAARVRGPLPPQPPRKMREALRPVRPTARGHVASA